MNKQELLRSITFGKRIAEEETAELNTYFVETDQWQRIFAGEVDVVYGAKGAGKSAMYSLLQNRADALFDRGVLIIAAENPRGAPIFKDLVADPPATEDEFRNLWKLYFLSLVGKLLRDYEIGGDPAQKVIDALEEAQLLQKENTLPAILRSVIDYVRSVIRAESIEGGLKLDPTTGLIVGATGKITLREPSSAQRQAGLISADTLFNLVNVALADSNFRIWVALDRLDVAFADSETLEGNALRALFRVYLDFLAYDRLSLKIFLRSDIWRRVTAGGFREASHITRHITIAWDKDTLLNLIIRRALRNDSLRAFYNVSEVLVLQDAQLQKQLFARVFPAQVNVGPNKPSTFDWMISRTRDGLGANAPREMIHLLISARDGQLKRLEMGNAEPPDETLFERITLREALSPISNVRLNQTLYAEYPNLMPYLQKLEGAKTQQTPETLGTIWGIDPAEALKVASSLRDVGFFERRDSDEKPVFWVPFLYREALRMVQGAATSEPDDTQQSDFDD